jgi:hypothetical protein
VQPVDAVPAVAQAGQCQQHVHLGIGDMGGGERAQGGWDAGAGVAAQHHRLGGVAAVAGVPGDVGGRVAEAVVVVLHAHQRPAPLHIQGALPGAGQGGEHVVEQRLHRVRTVSGVGQVADLERSLEVVGRQQGGHGSPFRGCRRKQGAHPRPTAP